MIRENSSICREWFSLWVDEVCSKFVEEVSFSEEKRILGWWIKENVKNNVLKEISDMMNDEVVRRDRVMLV